MANDDEELFTSDLIRMVAAELYSLMSLTASREMFGRSYYSLGIGEKNAVDQIVLQQVGGNYVGITPELLRSQGLRQPLGFEIPSLPQSTSKS